ncbi:unnamed protein product [Triticum turgidum subsp. durum]|uniref:CASP-like protein n=1 Tax=Triticum turgidum subsp. durum TaxID=4567 RepID=A0A9R1A5I3_TRITD|nr:unnamed protein product [Triticum turgidum subsp. durum]
MAIVYALVARGTVVLAEFAAVSGNAGAVARRILEKLPSEAEARLCFAQDRYIFHVLRSPADGLTFLCMANDTFGRRVPFIYLEDIQMRFMKNYGRVAHSALAYAMNDEFARVLHQQMEFFSSNPSADTLNRLRGEVSERKSGGGVPFILRSGAEGFRRCMAFVDLLLRVVAFGPTLAAAISTGTSDETLSVFTEFFQFRARFDDFPAFTFFMVANAVAAGYLVLSLPFSIVGIIRPKATGVRLLLLVCDTVMVVLVTAAASAAAAIVYVAHEGSRRANWVPICMQFHGFCQRTSGAVVASFLAVLVFILLVLLSACAIRRQR